MTSKSWGRFTPRSLIVYNLAHLDADRGRFEDARAELERVQSIDRGADMASSATKFRYEMLLTAIESGLGNLARAVDHATAAAAVAEELFGDSSRTAMALYDLGDCLLEDKRFSEARDALRRASAMLARLPGASPEIELSVTARLALIDLETGHPTAALKAIEPTVARYDQGDYDRAYAAEARFTLAKTLRALHRDPARARRLAEGVRSVFAEESIDKAANLAEIDAFLAQP